jgi:hypothetical protein
MNYVITKLLKKLEDGLNRNDVQYYYFGIPDVDNAFENIVGKGLIAVEPLSTSTTSITTGLQDEDTYSIAIHLTKKIRGNARNAQIEPGAQYLTRVMEGRDEDAGTALTNTIKYIVRNNFRTLGLMETGVEIDYESNIFDLEGAFSATMTIGVIEHTTQPIL